MPRPPPKSVDEGRWVTNYQAEYTWKVRELSPLPTSTPPQPITTTLATPASPTSAFTPLPPVVPTATKATSPPLSVDNSSPETPRHVHYRVCAQEMAPEAHCSFDAPPQQPPTATKRPSMDTAHHPLTANTIRDLSQPQVAPTSRNQPAHSPPASTPLINGTRYNHDCHGPIPIFPHPVRNTNPSTQTQTTFATPTDHVTAPPDAVTDSLTKAMRESQTALDRNAQILERVTQRLAENIDRISLTRACEPHRLPTFQHTKLSMAEHGHSLLPEARLAVDIGGTIQRLKAILEAP
ncbi:hypothetical protein H4R34_004657 [Dimargaris verticillata]|uniref:Uncharacterized protein n=1 Tax=Dimargaris verticillata TaxID=2761393 RepID=A0A9W8AYE8_9FUNG|nr:hypothetical protein H4R34_004657 [Dimargaris verticillata]